MTKARFHQSKTEMVELKTEVHLLGSAKVANSSCYWLPLSGNLKIIHPCSQPLKRLNFR